MNDLTRLETLVLNIPQKLVEQYPHCAELGGNFNVGKLMYRNIQTMYVQEKEELEELDQTVTS